jgi:DNA-binding helix-hairpin-helix protein with protein kinase domain
MPILFPSGEKLRIPRNPFGTGGEGKVYRVANEGKNGVIAKIYNSLPEPEKQKKLEIMTSMVNSSLIESCAWPIEVLTDSASGGICGFTMHEVADSEPLHHYYSPSWRKKNQPQASWDNLLQLCINLTAAFSVIHELGIIVGDVNPNSFRVRKNGRVALIDTDSFQLTHGGKLFKCKVGVPSFTAPELLSSGQSFDLITRKNNHDLFGLSLLIFHLLFMGRHPFAGVFTGPGDMPIESNIKEFRYAYAKDHKARGLLPPRLSINPRLVAGSQLVELFENDFTQIGAIRGRTTSGEWFKALTIQRRRLKRCDFNQNHVYDSSIGTCVWCTLEASGLEFFQVRSLFGNSSRNEHHLSKFGPLDLSPTKTEADAWMRISSHRPEKPVMPTISASTIKPRSNLTELELKAILRRSVCRLLSCLGVVLLLYIAQSASIPIVFIILVAGFNYSPRTIRDSVFVYKNQLSQAETEIGHATSLWHSLQARGGQDQALLSARKAWLQIGSLKDAYEKEISTRVLALRISDKRSFLSTYLIADAKIQGIGAGRLATLASHGIETAADLSEERLLAANGFGEVLTNALLGWRKKLSSQYIAPSDNKLLAGEDRVILYRYLKDRRKASAELQLAIETFDRIEAQSKERIQKCESVLIENLNLAASIKADIAQLRQPASAIYKERYPYLIF